MVVQDLDLMLSFEQSDQHIFRFSDEKQNLVWLKAGNEMDHDRDLVRIDCLPAQGLYISGCLDGYVKIWNIMKQLIREIKFMDPVYSVSFLDEYGDIIVGHGHKVSMITSEDYYLNEIEKIFNPEDEDIEEFQEKNQTEISA